MATSDWADWWDKQKRESEKILEEWVDENPQWWVVGLATAVQTSMDLGQGMVDVLRFGEGAAEGGWKGYGQDAMRLLVLLGPLGRAGGMASRFIHTSGLRLAVTLRGVSGPCTFTAVNNATKILNPANSNVFLTVREAAKALGKRLRDVAKLDGKYQIGAWIDDLIPFLRSQGTKIRALKNLNSIDDVVREAGQSNGVVIFAFRCVTRSGKTLRHSVIAVRDAFGRVKFADYGGKLFNSLEDLINAKPSWGGAPAKNMITLYKGAGRPGGAMMEGLEFTGLLEDSMQVLGEGIVLAIEGLTAIETAEDGVDLAIPVSIAAVPAPTQAEAPPPEVVQASFDAFKARKQGRPVIRMPEIRISGHPAPRAEYLTGVQYRLNAAGFGAGPVDGILGPRTKRAIRKFQETYRAQFNLSVDEVPGPKTQSALVSVCGY